LKRAKKRSQRVKISFAVTVLALSAITIVAYSLSFGIPTYSVPSNLTPYSGLVGKYGPSDALQVTFDNFTAIRAINSSAVQESELIRLTQPEVTVLTSSILQQVLVTLVGTNPVVNNSATAAILDTRAFSNLSRALASSKLAPDLYGPFKLYNLTDNANGRTRNEWMTLISSDSSVVFSEGTAGARSTVIKMLNVWEGSAPSILSLQNVTRMLYSVDGTKHLALSIQNFPGQVLTSDMGALAVDVVSGTVQVSNVVRFSNSTLASSQVSQVKSAYRFASDFSRYEESIKAIETFPLSNLQEAVGLAGR
jgi:hypothetical protein